MLGYLCSTGSCRRQDRADRAQAALFEATCSAVLPTLLHRRGTHGHRRAGLLGTLRSRTDHIRWTLWRQRDQRGVAVRAGAAAHGRRVTVHEVLPPDRSLPERRLTLATASGRGSNSGRHRSDNCAAARQGRGRARLDQQRCPHRAHRTGVLRHLEDTASSTVHPGSGLTGCPDRSVHLLRRP